MVLNVANSLAAGWPNHRGGHIGGVDEAAQPTPQIPSAALKAAFTLFMSSFVRVSIFLPSDDFLSVRTLSVMT